MGDFFEVTIDEDRIKIKIINNVIMIFLGIYNKVCFTLKKIFII